VRAKEFVVRSGAGADCKTQCVCGQRGERCLRDESAAWLSRSARSDRSKFSAAVASSMRALPASSAACLRADASAAPAAAAFSLCAYRAARTIWAVQVSHAGDQRGGGSACLAQRRLPLLRCSAQQRRRLCKGEGNGRKLTGSGEC